MSRLAGRDWPAKVITLAVSDLPGDKPLYTRLQELVSLSS
jgi:glycerate-2-kinase